MCLREGTEALELCFDFRDTLLLSGPWFVFKEQNVLFFKCPVLTWMWLCVQQTQLRDRAAGQAALPALVEEGSPLLAAVRSGSCSGCQRNGVVCHEFPLGHWGSARVGLYLEICGSRKVE